MSDADYQRLMHDRIDEHLNHHPPTRAVENTVGAFLVGDDVDMAAEVLVADAWETCVAILEDRAQDQQYHADVLETLDQMGLLPEEGDDER